MEPPPGAPPELHELARQLGANQQQQQHQQQRPTTTTTIDQWLELALVGAMVALIVVSVVGNCLVCLAIFTERRLRKLGNSFIVSLAIADLLVSCLVMTFALCNDLLMDHWIFGTWLCDMWISCDIMCCTASILNLCAISLDRFVHIKDCLLYNRLMTRRVAFGAVLLIWFTSALVSFLPINLGWHKPHQLDHQNHSGNLSTPHLSPFNNDSSEEPLLLKRQQLNQVVDLKEPADHQCQLALTPTYAVISSAISFYIPCIIMLGLYTKLFACARRHVRNIRAVSRAPAPLLRQHQPLCEAASQTGAILLNSGGGQLHAHRPPARVAWFKLKRSQRKKEKPPASQQPFLLAANNNNNHQSDSSRREPTMTMTMPTLTASREEKGQQLATHKAAVTLGIIMGTFLCCWVPFFCLNIIKAFCVDCIPSPLFRAFTWLGYANSALNPIIYGIHNSEFRQAFNRIFFKHLNIKNSRYYMNRRHSHELRQQQRLRQLAATVTSQQQHQQQQLQSLNSTDTVT